MRKDQNSTVWTALGFAWQFGYTVAVPLVLFTLGGRLLDKRFGTHPWLLITGVLLSIIISTTALIAKATKIMNQLDQNIPAKPPPDNGNFPRR